MSTINMYRTLLRVIPENTKLSEGFVTVKITGWDNNELVPIQTEQIPTDIVEKIANALNEPDTIYLFAEMNLGAASVEEVIFDKFEFGAKPRFKTLDELIAHQNQSA